MVDDVWVCNGVEFGAGTKVKIKRFEESDAPHGMGYDRPWENSWEAEMDEYLKFDVTRTIEFIDERGAHFDYESCPYAFPLTSLDKVESV